MMKMSTNSPTILAEELANELDKIPEQYWSNLLQIIRLFRESVTPVSESSAQDSVIVEAIDRLSMFQILSGLIPIDLR